MKLKDIMRPAPLTITETATLGNAQQLMRRARIRHLPVLADGTVTGMLSERDILAARARAQSDEDWWRIPVRLAMSAPAQTAGPDDSLTEAAGRLAAAKLGALPIVATGKLLGLVTVSDVLAAEVQDAMAPTVARTAADAMTPYPFAVNPETLLVDAVGIMIDHHIRHLPVVSTASAIVGMLGDRDVRTAIGEPSTFVQLHRHDAEGLRVHHCMRKGAKVVAFDTPLADVARHFADEHVGAVPVVDKFGALLGIVSYIDVLRVLAI